MTETYFVRYNAHTTEVEAESRDDAMEQAAEIFDDPSQYTDLEPHMLDDVERLRDGEFNELYTDVHVTLESDSEWTASLTIESNEDREYERDTLREIELVDELVLFGAAFHEMFGGPFEKGDVTVYVRGRMQDDQETCSLTVAESHHDL